MGAILTNGTVLAKQSAETINVIYDNIKILIDGKEYDKGVRFFLSDDVGCGAIETMTEV